MIKEFISEVNGGRSISLIAAVAEASKQGKKVAFLSLELPVQNVVKRLDWFGATKNITIINSISGNSTSKQLFNKIIELSRDFDIIAIDSVDVLLKNKDYQKLDDACFGSFMNSCNELWTTRQMKRDSAKNINLDGIKNHEEDGLFKIKQIIKKAVHPLFQKETFLEVLDLETKEIKFYNLNNLSKTKN